MSMSRMNRSNNSESRVYIGNLPDDIRTRELENLFSKYGKIVDVEIKIPRGGNGSAFAFLQYEDSRDADDAIRARDGYEFEGKPLRVEIPAPKRPRGAFAGGFGGRGGRGRGGRGRGGGPPERSDYRVLISNLPNSGSWQDMKDHMREAGEVVYADVFRDGSGIVEFAKRDDMDWAVKNLDDTSFKSHEGESARIRVKLDGNQRARSRSPRRSRSRSYSR